MARTISKEGLEQKMEKVQIAIARNREQYDKLTAESYSKRGTAESNRRKCKKL